jgi:hypothetical protein
MISTAFFLLRATPGRVSICSGGLSRSWALGTCHFVGPNSIRTLLPVFLVPLHCTAHWTIMAADAVVLVFRRKHKKQHVQKQPSYTVTLIIDADRCRRHCQISSYSGTFLHFLLSNLLITSVMFSSRRSTY